MGREAIKRTVLAAGCFRCLDRGSAQDWAFGPNRQKKKEYVYYLSRSSYNVFHLYSI
jgi:hypothetical protein